MNKKSIHSLYYSVYLRKSLSNRANILNFDILFDATIRLSNSYTILNVYNASSSYVDQEPTAKNLRREIKKVWCFYDEEKSPLFSKT